MKKTTSFVIESDTLEKFKAIAQKQERSMNFLIVKLIDEYLNQKP